MILWTLRHTKPFNPTGVCYGRLNFDVSPSFEQEAEPAISAIVQNAHAERLFASPLLRCQRFAAKVSEALKLPVETVDALQEVHFGSWENVKLTDVPKAEMSAWKRDLRGYRFPGGESFHDVEARVQNFLRTILGEKEVLCVTHAGVIGAIEHSICGLSDDRFVEGEFPYAMLTRFEIEAAPDGSLHGSFQKVYGGIPQMSLTEIIQEL